LWTLGESNSSPPECKTGALPYELRALIVFCDRAASSLYIYIYYLQVDTSHANVFNTTIVSSLVKGGLKILFDIRKKDRENVIVDNLFISSAVWVNTILNVKCGIKCYVIKKKWNKGKRVLFC
jgi:hypothetical protein